MKFESVATISDSNVTNVKSVKMGFSEDAIPHLTQMFVNLYNNPEEAVYREILFNAIDAIGGIEDAKNVEVWLPTSETPVLTIIDYGCGMGPEDLEKAVQFGGTNKNGDNNSVGGFGLGMKSPLAITSQFSVETIKDGFRTVGTISNSENGICELIPLIHEETDLPNGTTVSIPVKDYRKFREIATRYSSYVPDVITYYNGDEYPMFYKREHYTSYANVTEHLYNVESYSTSYTLTVVMGGVPYVVHLSDISDHIPELNGLFRNTRGQYILEVPIGSLRLSPNREGVQFNKQTKETLYNILREEVITVIDESIEKVKNADNFFDAVEVFNSTILKDFSRIADMSWNGIPLRNRTTSLGYDFEEYTDQYGNKRSKNIYQEFKTITQRHTGKVTSIAMLDKGKTIFVEPHEDVKPSRVTYTVRRYLQKNDGTINAERIYYLNKKLDEYSASRSGIKNDSLVDVPELDDKRYCTLKSLLDLYGQDYEVISISEMKKDIDGWKPEGEKVETPKVKFLEKKILVYVAGEDGYLKFKRETVADIMGDGNKVFAIYESNKKKDSQVHPNHLKMTEVVGWLKFTYGVDSVDGIIFLENNSKKDVFERNTKKFKNKYYTIELFTTIVDHRSYSELKEVLDKDIDWSSWELSGKVRTVSWNLGKINDKELIALFKKGTVDLVPDEIYTLRRYGINRSDTFRNMVKEFLETRGFSSEVVENLIETYSYSGISIYEIISKAYSSRVHGYLKKNYPLYNESMQEESVKYMNLMFDHKNNV